jgi:cellulose synthase/poly-beta-1,6-N-acetylglucosamine synthase-like glycosyltransferase
MNPAIVTEVLAWVLLAFALPGTLYLAMLTIAGVLPSRGREAKPLAGRLAFVIPAHNESAGIARTLDNLRAEAARDSATDVIVVADNCSDDTAAKAQACGARVLVRHDTEKRGKGYALHHAFETLRRDDHVAYVIVDADSQVDPGFISAIRRHLGAGAMAVQARYTVLNGDETPRTRIAELALAGWNVLRPRGRERLRLSVGLLGNGFALRRHVIDVVPYTATSVVEDFEYHLALIEADIAVRFADDATVRGEMPTNAAAASSQQARWEGGRLQMLRSHGAQLGARVLRGDWRYIDPLADLLLPPLAYLVALLVSALALGLLPGVSAATPLTASLMTAVIAAHVVSAIPIAGLPWRRLWLLARVPGYLTWKLLHLGGVLHSARHDAPWVRTARNASSEGASS